MSDAARTTAASRGSPSLIALARTQSFRRINASWSRLRGRYVGSAGDRLESVVCYDPRVTRRSILAALLLAVAAACPAHGQPARKRPVVAVLAGGGAGFT